jgi:histidine ammonia-lyase
VPGDRSAGAARNLAALAPVHARVRSDVPTLTDDRPPSPDIEAISELIARGSLERACAIEVK